MSGRDWADERSEIIAAQAAAADRARAAETRQAAGMIADFVEQAHRRGIEPGPLFASGRGGRGRYRTDLTGWYLKKDETVAVDTEGRYYIMFTSGGLRERLTGARMTPTDPPLVVGRGGRDGESMDLSEALEKRLAAG